MKVFCSRCKFYVPGYTIPYSFGPPDEIKEKCMSPKNFFNSYVSENVRPKSKPSVINKYNNCIWYEPKEGIPIPDPPRPLSPDDDDCPCCSSSSSSSGGEFIPDCGYVIDF